MEGDCKSRLTSFCVNAPQFEYACSQQTANHLGSSSFITNTIGYATQHLQYLPFGETFVDQQNGYDSRYTFSAKEKDDETQYSYFGARYYDSDLSVWLSVDPMSDDYPSTSGYMYCLGKPTILVDPNGMDTALIHALSGNLIDMHKGGEDYVYTTTETEASESAWENSEQLFYSLNISGESGGTVSEKGAPVIWSDLQDKTNEFDQILKNSMFYWSMMQDEFNDENFLVPLNKSIDKNLFFRSMVNDNAPFDIKRSSYHPRRIGEWSWYHGRLTRYDDYGNLLFGAIGSAFGMSEGSLLRGAKLNQMAKGWSTDDWRDQGMILQGIIIFNYYQSVIPTIR